MAKISGAVGEGRGVIHVQVGSGVDTSVGFPQLGHVARW